MLNFVFSAKSRILINYKDKVMLDTLLGATKDKIRLTKQTNADDKIHV